MVGKLVKFSEKFFKKIISNHKDCLFAFYSATNNLTPWIIRATPIRTAANTGFVSEVPPRINATIPKIMINIEASFDTPSPENRPAIPKKISKIPIM